MPTVGTRRVSKIGDMSSDPMYGFARDYREVQQNILKEDHIDYSTEPAKALAFESSVGALQDFFLKESTIPFMSGTRAGSRDYYSAKKLEDERSMMTEAFQNDVEAIRENAVASLATWNPMIGLSLPMHKYLMLNCVFAQALPRFVAKSPSWSESIETRYMIAPDGRKIDLANQQNQIYNIWRSANPSIEVPIALPEAATVDILDTYFSVDRVNNNLSVATHINGIAVEDFVKAGDKVLTIGTDGTITEDVATADGVALVWKPWKGEFTPGYGDANRVCIQPVDIMVSTDGTEATETLVHDTLFAAQRENMFEINSTSGNIKAVRMLARFDASGRNRKTPRVEWGEKTMFVQIPEADGITVPITPEEVKDIGALYGINQVTKYMSMIRDVLENVKDDDIHEYLDDCFVRLDDDHRIAKTIDFAPRHGYYSDHYEWLQKTFMGDLDQYITGMMTILRDPNMEINILGRPALIRMITPVEYSYQSTDNAGQVELDFRKTVVTSDKRVYNFISSDKLFGNDTLIVLLIPKNTNRIVYRVYDYQMYISNEIRDVENPQLPALTAFQRYKTFSLGSGFEVQGRLFVANPTGRREHIINRDPLGRDRNGDLYANNDLAKLGAHYYEPLGRNATPEEIEAYEAEQAAAGDGGSGGGTP